MSILVIIAVVAAITALIVYGIYQEKKRTEELESAAKSMGFTFQKTVHSNFVSTLGSCRLFNHGHSRRFTNVLQQKKHEHSISHFDFTYTTGSGKNSSTHRQSVTLFNTASLTMPDFVMGPENFLHKIGDQLGFGDIDFNDSPEFSDRYRLKGNDENAIRATFTKEIRNFFTEHPDYTVEGKQGMLLLYKYGKRFSAFELPTIIEQRLTILKLFLNRNQ